METCPGERVMKEKKFTHTRKPYHKWVSGGLCNLRGEHNQKKRERKKQNICLTAITSREMAQTLTSSSSEWGLRREVQAVSYVSS